MIILIVLIGLILLFFILPIIDGIRGKSTFSRLYGIRSTDPPEDVETLETIEAAEAVKREQREILDNALIKYNRLLSVLESQYKTETDNKKRAAILSKQITTLEKLNRVIEKREKLE